MFWIYIIPFKFCFEAVNWVAGVFPLDVKLVKTLVLRRLLKCFWLIHLVGQVFCFRRYIMFEMTFLKPVWVLLWLVFVYAIHWLLWYCKICSGIVLQSQCSLFLSVILLRNFEIDIDCSSPSYTYTNGFLG